MDGWSAAVIIAHCNILSPCIDANRFQPISTTMHDLGRRTVNLLHCKHTSEEPIEEVPYCKVHKHLKGLFFFLPTTEDAFN